MHEGLRRIGAHLPLGTGMVKAADRAAEIGADAIQIFSDNPTAWRRRATPPRELEAFRSRLDDLGIWPLAIHASYLINLAGGDEAFHDKSVDVLEHELLAAELYGAPLVNVHIGSHKGLGLEAGVERVATTIERAMTRVGDRAPVPKLALENSAGGGFGLGGTIAELRLVLEAIAARGIPEKRIGLCLDTAHLWGAGYDISTATGVDAMLDELDAEVGLRRVAMLHLNDSRAELGSNVDRHQHIGAGQIGPGGMAAVLCNPRLHHVPAYLETPGMDDGYDAINISRCRELMAGLPLADLSEAALSMPGSRSRSAPARDPGDEEEEDGRGRKRQRPANEGARGGAGRGTDSGAESPAGAGGNAGVESPRGATDKT
jgi:deoxyribonuclease-4